MTRQRDVHRAIAFWYVQQQLPVRDRLVELLADYAPQPGESTTSVICRMRPDDQAEALDLAAVLALSGDPLRRMMAARAAVTCSDE